MNKLPFKQVFMLFQLMIVLIIFYSAFLGFKIFSVTEQSQKLESQRYWMMASLNKYRVRSDNLSFLARQYEIERKLSTLERYRMIEKNKSATLKRQVTMLPSKEVTDGLHQGSFSLAERALLIKVFAVSMELRSLEQSVFVINKIGEAAAKKPNFVIAQLQSKNYLTLNLQILTLLDRIFESVNNRYREIITQADEDRTLMIYAIPFVLLFNFILLTLAFLFINRRMREHHAELEELALKDPLTGAHNRKFILETGPHLLSINQRENTKMAVIMADIDHFKIINARFGYDAGDLALKAFSRLIRTRVRKTDLFARCGSEEFIIMLNNVSAIHAMEWADQLRHSVSRYTVDAGRQSINFTVSLGVVLSDSEVSLEQLTVKADKALHRAKKEGRDQVVRSTD